MPQTPHSHPPLSAADTTPSVSPPDPIASLRTSLRGHYEFERELGQGAFATVYLARDLKHERKVAIKVLHADPGSDLGELRFIREIRMLARLQHPNILPLHDSGHVATLLYYVMPYVNGETVRDRLERERQLPLETACSIARDVADALAYAHQQGIIHRDIKPENILMSAGHPMLADFGIARAIDLAGVRQLTRTGMGSPGTPAYMSPEQLLGEKESDARSDTYSLGCVLFEMLTGRPPFSGKDGFVKRFTEPPPRTRSLRVDLPAWIDDVVARAMERSPEDRYQTALEFKASLDGPATSGRFSRGSSGTSPIATRPAARAASTVQASPDSASTSKAPPSLFPQSPQSPGPPPQQYARVPASPGWRSWFHRRALIAAGIAAFILASAAALARNRIAARGSLFGPEPDSTRIALIPFGGTAPRTDRDRVLNQVYAGLTDWRDLRLASDQDVAQAAAEATPNSTRAAAEIAVRVGAGQFIWGQLNSGDPSQARVGLFDVSSSVPRKSVALPITSDGSGVASAIRLLLMSPGRPASADGADGRTRSYQAWSAYGRGHADVQSGDFPAAERQFAVAAIADPEFGPARVWLGQVRAWLRPGSLGDWRDDIAPGIHAKSGLSARDSMVGAALAQLIDRRFPEACTTYARMVAVDSLDFVGLYGMGQCRLLDSLVVPSASSPSKWQFRSRYSEAASAFIKAVRVNPGAHAIVSFAQMEALLPIASTKTRRGTSASGEEFAAYPSLLGDSVVFVPYPLREFGRLSPQRTAFRQAAAIAKDLDALLQFATEWTRRAPQSARAYLALAEVLEARGEIERSRASDLSALQAIGRARQLAANQREQILAATTAAWLLFKQGEFGRARMLADSILESSRPKASDEATSMIGLAALTGKIARTAELSRVAIPYAANASSVPLPVMDAAAPFFALAALGVCTDSTIRVEQRLDDQIARYVAEDQQIRTTMAVKTRPLTMLAPCTAGKSSLRIPSGSSRIVLMEQAVAKGDLRGARSMLDSLTNESRSQRPGDIALDIAYLSAWLRAAVGDTAGAERQLDRTLGALPSISAPAIREPASAAAAGRAMAFRAELAAARGESDTRQKWARAVSELWATADAPLQGVVNRMRGLAGTR